MNKKTCEWKRDGDGGYYVKCGDFRVIELALRDVDWETEHDFNFCPYCGGKLTVKDNAKLSGGEAVRPDDFLACLNMLQRLTDRCGMVLRGVAEQIELFGLVDEAKELLKDNK